ncbi:helix-turn-helix domain-containing protein [Polaribacter sp. L3A8]|uniref:helix-turn-helix domain-containing protein n=1 Tax=Polaribacter sp. L3A8 TaxID=2686361 RepID=UPI001E484EB3|nr:AraC family transcriptional regulator [Polaribacter sp. L3A8]
MLIISVISFRYFFHGSYDLGLQAVLKPDSGLYSLLFLILAPSLYLYYKHLVNQKKAYDSKDLKHLFFIIFLYLINSIEVLHNSFLFYFGAMTNFYLISIFVIFYLVIIFNLLKKEVWFRKNLLLNKHHFNLVKNWTIYFFVINILCSIMVFISLYTEFKTGEKVSGKTMAVFSMIFWLSAFFKILISPEILYGLPILNKTLLKFNETPINKKERVTLVNNVVGNNWVIEVAIKEDSQDHRLQENIRTNIVSYIKEVDKLSTEKFIFRSQKVSQSDIAETLGVPTSHIVYLFKYHSKISFTEYRKNSRIQDALKLIEGGFLNTETFESLAYKTGFASYNPFFIAFKSITTYSPQDYNKVKKE